MKYKIELLVLQSQANMGWWKSLFAFNIVIISAVFALNATAEPLLKSFHFTIFASCLFSSFLMMYLFWFHRESNIDLIKMKFASKKQKKLIEKKYYERKYLGRFFEQQSMLLLFSATLGLMLSAWVQSL